MNVVYPRFGLLVSWAMLGVLVLLCAPWLMPSNKLYHQVLIVLLWLPALLAFKYSTFRRLLLQPEFLLFLLFGSWTLIVTLFLRGTAELGETKLPFYVALSLLGLLLAAQQEKYSIEMQLLLCALVAGPFALWSVVDFYWLSGNDLTERVMAVGLWDKIIMAAHAVGALLVLGILLSLNVRAGRSRLLIILAVAAMGFFVLMSQTRGVWIALVAAFIVVVLARPSRLGIVALAFGVLSIILVALLFPDFLAQRGLSYRPELFRKGLAIFLENWKFGVGVTEYGITVESLGQTFKHPHNLYLDTGIRWGVIGLALFIMLWGSVGWRAWRNRGSSIGIALLGLWTFSSVSLLTDGIGLWFKPNADWLVTWLPIAIGLILAARESSSLIMATNDVAVKL